MTSTLFLPPHVPVEMDRRPKRGLSDFPITRFRIRAESEQGTAEQGVDFDRYTFSDTPFAAPKSTIRPESEIFLRSPCGGVRRRIACRPKSQAAYDRPARARTR